PSAWRVLSQEYSCVPIRPPTRSEAYVSKPPRCPSLQRYAQDNRPCRAERTREIEPERRCRHGRAAESTQPQRPRRAAPRRGHPPASETSFTLPRRSPRRPRRYLGLPASRRAVLTGSNIESTTDTARIAPTTPKATPTGILYKSRSSILSPTNTRIADKP